MLSIGKRNLGSPFRSTPRNIPPQIFVQLDLHAHLRFIRQDPVRELGCLQFPGSGGEQHLTLFRPTETTNIWVSFIVQKDDALPKSEFMALLALDLNVYDDNIHI